MGVETLDVNLFEASEFRRLLEAESRVWQDELRWDFTGSAQLISSCLEEKRVSGYALVAAGRITGYCLYFYDGEKGVIGDLFVEHLSVGLDGARTLLKRAVDDLLTTPGLRRVEAQLPHFSFEKLEPCFLERCFEGYRRRFMAAPLANRLSGGESPNPGRAASARESRSGSEDFLIQPWERRHDREAAQLLYGTYSRHVDTLINDQYATFEGTSRLVENIVHNRGCGEYLAQHSLVAIHRSSQKLAALLALTAVRPRTAHIPQIAVANQFQGSGLGTALMGFSFQELAGQGYEEVSLTVTDLNAGAVRLYERLGFETFRTFGAFAWNRPARPPLA